MKTQSKTPVSLNGEISMGMIGKIIYRGKYKILGVTALGMIFGGLVSSVMPKVYESSTTVLLPKVVDMDLLKLTPSTLLALVMSDKVLNGVVVKDGKKVKLAQVREAELVKADLDGNSGTLVLTTHGKTAQDAYATITSWGNSINARVYSYTRNLLDEQQRMASDNVKSVDQALTKLNKLLLVTGAKGENVALEMAMGSAYGQQYIAAVSNRDQLNSLGKRLKNFTFFEVITRPQLPDKPVSPNILMNIVFGGIFFGFLSLCVVLIKGTPDC